MKTRPSRGCGMISFSEKVLIYCGLLDMQTDVVRLVRLAPSKAGVSVPLVVHKQQSCDNCHSNDDDADSLVLL